MITRRAFLGGAVVGGAALACGGPRRSAAPVAADGLVLHGWLGPFPALLEQRLRDGLLAGVTIVRQNVTSLSELVRVVERIRSLAPRPILVCCTQEGGSSRPLAPELTAWPAALRFADAAVGGTSSEADAEALAEACGRAQGDELRAIGFDVNFAPVLDVHTNPANPIIGDRAFGRDAATATRLAAAWARGHAASGMITCGKHFPGHGDTATDSHRDLPVVDAPRERLEAVELAPFAALAKTLPMMMTAHVVYPALDRAPATLSRPIVTGLLRERLGHEGVIVTDDLEMRAILGRASIEEAAVEAFQAGCDAILVAHTPALAARAAAALTASADPARIRASLARLAALPRPVSPRPALEVVGTAAHRALAARAG